MKGALKITDMPGRTIKSNLNRESDIKVIMKIWY
jgi:hypothetical protein